MPEYVRGGIALSQTVCAVGKLPSYPGLIFGLLHVVASTVGCRFSHEPVAGRIERGPNQNP